MARAAQLAARAHERRTDPRVRLRTAVHFSSDSNFYTGLSRDISEGGVFIATYDLLPVGTVLDLELSLPGSPKPISARGEVRWVAEPNDLSDGHPGFGVKMLDLAETDRKRIEAFVNLRESLFFDE